MFTSNVFIFRKATFHFDKLQKIISFFFNESLAGIQSITTFVAESWQSGRLRQS